jgi:hypothetical protein
VTALVAIAVVLLVLGTGVGALLYQDRRAKQKGARY